MEVDPYVSIIIVTVIKQFTNQFDLVGALIRIRIRIRIRMFVYSIHIYINVV